MTALNALATRLGYQALAAAPDSRGNRVAFLTRVPPLGASQQIVQFQLPQGIVVSEFDSSGAVSVVTQFSRPALQITVANGARQVEVITAHLKSKLLTFGGNFSMTNETLRAHTAFFALERRAAEATGIRE